MDVALAVKSVCLRLGPSGERSLLSRQPSLWRHDSRPFNVRALGVMKTRGLRDDVTLHGPEYLSKNERNHKATTQPPGHSRQD